MKKIVVGLGIIFIVVIGMVAFTKLSQTDEVQYTDTNVTQINSMIKSKKTFIVYFYQKGCPSCEQVKPIINHYIITTHQKIFAIDINKDSQKSSILQQFEIQGTPTVLFLNRGVENNRLVSVFSKAEFKERAEKLYEK